MKLIVQGPQQPFGQVTVSGAKNSATRLLAAAFMCEGDSILENFPTTLLDCQHKINFLRHFGIDVQIDESTDQLTISPKNSINEPLEAPPQSPIRTTYLLVQGQLTRHGRSHIPYPGGCKIGSRKHDVHIEIWEQFGCTVRELPDGIYVEGKLTGVEIELPFRTVGGTENAILCAAAASGTSKITGAYITPEVTDLISFLRKSGASIWHLDDGAILVDGRNGLLPGNARHQVMSDRIEAISWCAFAGATNSILEIDQVPLSEMEIPLIHLRDMGLIVEQVSKRKIRVGRNASQGSLRSFELACGVHPGVVSDMQPLFGLLALKATGKSTIHDYRYPERYKYAEEYNKLNNGVAQISHGKVTIKGNLPLQGALMDSPDLRGSIACIFSAFLAEGESVISKSEYALRGYHRLETKLRSLGLRFDVQHDD